jgi:hypothetical protein
MIGMKFQVILMILEFYSLPQQEFFNFYKNMLGKQRHLEVKKNPSAAFPCD